VNPFALDPATLDSPAARQARAAGLLQVKRAAAQRAARLASWGRPLLVGVIVVSALHIFETLAGFRPVGVKAPEIAPQLYHLTAGALTLAIDLAALWLTAARGVLALAGVARRWYGLAFFLSLTALLNAAYMLRHAPDLDAAAVLPALDGAFAVLLPLAVPVAIASVEGAAQQLEAARLALLVEAAALRPLADVTAPAEPVGQSAPAPNWAGQVLVAQPLPSWPRESYPAPVEVRTPEAAQASTEAWKAPRYACPKCGAELTAGQYGAARKHGHCRSCKGA
jgi:hypothetical protein